MPEYICYQVALQLRNRVKRKYRGIIEPSVPYEGSLHAELKSYTNSYG
jgi:hypothetical protein